MPSTGCQPVGPAARGAIIRAHRCRFSRDPKSFATMQAPGHEELPAGSEHISINRYEKNGHINCNATRWIDVHAPYGEREQMACVLTEADVIAAFRMLFPLDMKVNGSLLESLQPSDVTGAYRRRALETHPDRFFGTDERFRRACSERFIAVREAYTTLRSYLKLRQENVFRFPADGRAEPGFFRGNRSSGRPHPETAGPSGPSGGDRFSSTYWQKGPPHRSLRLAEFLYYSGVVPWRVWIEGIVWQRNQRPRVGEIARKWRWLTEAQIRAFLKNRRSGERFGETLLRHHIINPFQLRVLLSHQQRAQRPIGGFFVDNGFLTEEEIGRFLERQRIHNFRYEKDAPGKKRQ